MAARAGGTSSAGRASAGGPGASAQQLLQTGTAVEVLARIVPEDPLGLRARIGARLLERALLLDTERVLLRAQALCALHAPAWRGQPELAPWLEERIEEALEECLADDGPGRAPAAGVLELFARSLALDPAPLAMACARFNRLAREQREAFIALVLEARAPERLARARGLSLTELARQARTALELFRRS